MYEPRYYDSPPVYSPPYSTTSHSLCPPRSIHSPQSQYVSYAHQPPPDSYYMEGQPQHFYRWFSPPGFVKTFQGTTAVMCFIIFACVASTLVWDMNGFGYGVYGVGDVASVGGAGSGYYGGSYGYGGSYMTPQSAKAAMISMVAVNFLVSLSFLVGSFSRSRMMRGCRFYLTIFICDIILAVLQGIIDIIFVIGVNPMSQSSQSMLYNPMLRMCQNIQGTPSLSGSVGAGFPGGFPMYNQYLYHYCFMDPEEAVGFVLGLLVIVALSISAYYAYKTRSKIWRHGKSNILWDEPIVRLSDGHDVLDWQRVKNKHFFTEALKPAKGSGYVFTCTSVMSSYKAKAKENDMEAYIISKVDTTLYPEAFQEVPAEPQSEPRRGGTQHPAGSHRCGVRACSARPEGGEQRQPQQRAQYETGYTSGDTGNELDWDQRDYLYRLYPAITTDEQRRQYKREFDSDLAHYKRLCSEMDHVSDQVHKLSRELDTLDEGSVRYQGVADEYNLLKDLKKVR
uniref:Zgc:154006 n=1 Tax=Poecilia formosa TaxID=48698 RepID=A0A096M054_POEFO